MKRIGISFYYIIIEKRKKKENNPNKLRSKEMQKEGKFGNSMDI